MRVLIACEFSGIVRDEFIKRGHDALSCDILPTERKGPHYQGDVFNIIDGSWDLIIAFPPCTHLSSSGTAYWKQKQADGRQQQGIDFFMKFVNAKCEKIAIENPVGIMNTVYRKPDQIVHPYYFGDSFQKRTCLWLKNLPKLIPTKMVDKGEMIIRGNGEVKAKWLDRMPHKDRAKNRSKTFPGIAQAMGDQWG